MDKPLSQEQLSESDIRVIEADLFGVTRIIKDRVFHEMYANSRNMSIKLLAEVKRLQAIESNSFDMYKTALEIIATSDDPYYIGTVTHRTYARNILNIGDESHESN